MSECPIAKQFLRMLPPGVLYDFVKRPKPYIIPCRSGRFFITSELETAVIDFARRYAKHEVIMHTKPMEKINVQIPDLFSPDADSQPE